MSPYELFFVVTVPILAAATVVREIWIRIDRKREYDHSAIVDWIDPD